MIPPLALARRAGALAARHRSALLVAAAIGFGALAVFGARGYLAERIEIEKARLAPSQATVEVVVARHDLEAGAVVDAGSMAVREVPVDLVPGSAVRPDRFEQHVGARIGAPMRSGEPLLAGVIVGADGSTFSTRIRPGIRAMSVLVDEVNSVSGMLQPGDRIDLLFTVRPPALPGMPPAQEVTSTLMQDLAVLATGRQVRADKGDAAGMRHFTAITVEVSPSQAQELIVAQRSGKLTAMLRNPEDRQPLRARAMDLNALLGIDVPQRAPVVPRPIGPEIIVGGRGALVATASLGPAPIEGFEAVRPPEPGAAQQMRAPIVDAPAIPAPPNGGADEPAWRLHRFARSAAREMPTVQPTPEAQ
ncbi:MAG: Flp pilus assembly protein CpaB [Burkholderiaceae bacterium]|nr:Flp pilus assembly protein CpaB [Burkholderiaceae bacterium]